MFHQIVELLETFSCKNQIYVFVKINVFYQHSLPINEILHNLEVESS